MEFLDLLPHWSQQAFKYSGLTLRLEEKLMDCSNCSVYRSTVKCCTFFPDLPNFACGIELKKSRNRFDELLNDSEIALPLGIHAPARYKEHYSNSSFGTNEDLLCPHFDKKQLNCSIWSSRPSSCVGFVCKSSAADVGQEIWREAEKALKALEMNLAYSTCLELGLVNYEINCKAWPISAFKKQNFYERAADYVLSLSAAEMSDLAGEEFTSALTKIELVARAASL